MIIIITLVIVSLSHSFTVSAVVREHTHMRICNRTARSYMIGQTPHKTHSYARADMYNTALSYCTGYDIVLYYSILYHITLY